MSGRARTSARLACAAALALTLALALGVAPAAAKKLKSVITVTGANATSVPVPEATTTTNGQVASTITLQGKPLAGRRIRDVNATLQTTGTNPVSGATLTARLISPNNTATWLLGGDTFSQDVGPLTLDDETFVSIESGPVGSDVTRLAAPYNGTAQPDCFLAFGQCGLFVLDNGPVAGEWTLLLTDTSTAGPATSTLVGWSLRVRAGRPYRAK